MSFIDHAQILIPALSGLAVTVFKEDGDTQPLELFEENTCFFKNVQTFYTKNGFLSFFRKMSGGKIYTVTDPLDIHAVIVKVVDRWVILGPYAVDPWQDHNGKVLLANCGIQSDAFLPYKFYRCNLPIFGNEYVERVAALILTQVAGNESYEIDHIDMTVQKAFELPSKISDSYNDFAQINHRYAVEEQLMAAVQHGKTEEALKLFEEAAGLRGRIRIFDDSISGQIASCWALRALVRRAAISGGLTQIYVDSLSQEYAQQMNQALNMNQLHDVIAQYLAAFCCAIRKSNKTDYSLYVKRAVQYIELNLSQSISVDTLSEMNGITRQHFTGLWRKEVGMTVKQYIMRERCALAASLLENSRVQIQEISHYVGYDDTNYFTRVFKNVMGVTPQEYKKTKAIY